MSGCDIELEKAISIFVKKFNSQPEVAVFAPGRVNLIGEHVDYNMGYVLPFALPFRTIIVGSIASGKESRVYSSTVDSASATPAAFVISKELGKGEPEWLNYVKGTIYYYLNDLPENAAFNAVIVSTVPLGSGLSSSAALEVATATFLENLYGLEIDPVEKARRCQKAEHTFADTPCGIMDQFISALGLKDHLLLVDCRTQDYERVPFGEGSNTPVVLVTNSNVKHNLSGSEYPVRVKQCNEALAIFKRVRPNVSSLRDVTSQMLNESRAYDHSLDGLIFRRARHCVTENERTLAVVEALKVADFATVGAMMTQSHNSLRDDYEVSCKELDTLVEIALETPGVLGSRMTGGGFGGCTVTLVMRDSVDLLETVLKEEYRKATGIECVTYRVLPADGAGSLDLPLPPRRQRSGSVLVGSLEVPVPIAVAVVGAAVLLGVSLLSRRK